MSKSNNQPVHEIRLGHVKATIWANEVKTGTGKDRRTTLRHGVKLARLYHDGKGWVTTEAFNRDDLPLVAKVADMVHTWIYAQAQEHARQPENGRSRSSNEVEMAV